MECAICLYSDSIVSWSYFALPDWITAFQSAKSRYGYYQQILGLWDTVQAIANAPQQLYSSESLVAWKYLNDPGIPVEERYETLTANYIRRKGEMPFPMILPSVNVGYTKSSVKYSVMALLTYIREDTEIIEDMPSSDDYERIPITEGIDYYHPHEDEHWDRAQLQCAWERMPVGQPATSNIWSQFFWLFLEPFPPAHMIWGDHGEEYHEYYDPHYALHVYDSEATSGSSPIDWGYWHCAYSRPDTGWHVEISNQGRNYDYVSDVPGHWIADIPPIVGFPVPMKAGHAIEAKGAGILPEAAALFGLLRLLREGE